MKKSVLLFTLLFLLSGCSEKKNKEISGFAYDVTKADTRLISYEEKTQDYEIYSNGVSLSDFIDKAREIGLKEDVYPKEKPNKYNKYFNEQYYEGWCSEFVFYCLSEADKAMGSSFMKELYSAQLNAWNVGLWYKRNNRYFDANSGYLPCKGDVIIFDFEKYHYPDHTGLITDVVYEDGKFYILTIEGNIPSDRYKVIRTRKLPIDDPDIFAFCSSYRTEKYKGNLYSY